MLGQISFPFLKIGSAYRSRGKSPELSIFAWILLTLFSTTVHSAADVEIQGAPAIVNSTAPFSVTAIFSEIVTDFIATDVAVGNGSATSVSTGDGGISYSVEITPTGGGDISIDIPADVALDAALEGNTAATQVNVVYDATPPSVDIQGEPATISSDTPFNITVEFSEDVTGFIATDILVTNAAVTNFTPVDGHTYDVEITLNDVDDISIDIAAGVALDAGMNDNTAAPQAIIVFANIDPIADAGPDRFVNEGAPVALDGSASSDISPDAVAQFSWTQTIGPAVALNDSSAEMPVFTTPFVFGNTVLQFELVVTDRVGASSVVDSVIITVTNTLAADAGVDQLVTEGEIVQLNGLNSLSLDRRVVRYQWIQVEGPIVTLGDARSATPSFISPQVAATTLLVFEPHVVDASGARDIATTFVNVLDQSSIATASPLDVQMVNKSVASGALYQFDTIGDPFGLNAVAWSQVSGPDVTLDNANPVVPSFTAPAVSVDIPAGFEVRSTDLDGVVARAGVNVNIFESLPPNDVPVADAGVDQVVAEGDTVQLDATSSSDGDGVVVGYQWHQTSGPGVLLSSIVHARPTFVAPAIAPTVTDTTLSFEVVVIDDGGFIDRDSVTVAYPDNGVTGFDDELITIDSALGDTLGIQVNNGAVRFWCAR
jgi:hypothetical protein